MSPVGGGGVGPLFYAGTEEAWTGNASPRLRHLNPGSPGGSAVGKVYGKYSLAGGRMYVTVGGP